MGRGREKAHGDGEGERGRESSLPNYYFLLFYNKNNNILIKWTRLFFVRGRDALVYYCSLGSITVHLSE